MSSLLPNSGFQLPFQRRLSRLYNDTKRSSDFVKEPVQNAEDPEMKALHRKLRIQKDRLVSWGLEWSDPNQSVEIDESLSKAGLSEVVGSIMSTIKDILAEAEPLWQSSIRPVTSRTSSDQKIPLVQWDKGQFEDLVRDLTASIDTLYDLSRTRASGYLPRRMSKPICKSSGAEDYRPFESSRIQTPQQISPQSLTHLRPKQQYKADVPPREVVFMSKIAYSELNQGTTTKEPRAPLLLEYAVFDPIYSITGIMPPMSRFEKLSSALQQDFQRAPGTWTGLPCLLGYFEDLDNSRIGLVYRFPPSLNTVSTESLTKSPLYNLPTLRDLLIRQVEPPLEAKFRLAYNLANTIFDMHERGLTHGNLVDKIVSFCDFTISESEPDDTVVDIRRPLVSSFDVFQVDGSASPATPWRHPLDTRDSPPSTNRPVDERVLELYSLAMILLSVGLWAKLEDLLPDPASTIIPASALNQLTTKCGTLYMKAVQACYYAVDNEVNGKDQSDSLLSTVQIKASRFLETCCILDSVSGHEQRMPQELRETPPASERSEMTKDAKTSLVSSAYKKSHTAQRDVFPLPFLLSAVEDSTLAEDLGTQDVLCPWNKLEAQIKHKMRLYPHVPIAPNVVDKWNTILMPQVNQALRHFYKKHPESVEISLESVGPNPHSTKPTVVVVCTSVGKVRAILKKRLGEFFDETTGFSLKVCRGQVLRSYLGSVIRSMASTTSEVQSDVDRDHNLIEAVNPKYQARPENGASIGAWIGDRHLPPVSFGGLVLVDDKLYGMTVHHMLDDPDEDTTWMETFYSSAVPGRDWYSDFVETSGEDDGDYACGLSDTESEVYSETDITSDYGDEGDGDEDEFIPGDTPGIEPGCGEGYIITQPALDDVEEGFYPCAETEDEDHLDTSRLGEIYASSGIRRKQANGLTHEVDWALFQFADGRLPEKNSIPRCEAGATDDIHIAQARLGDDDCKLQPTTVAPSSTLPGLEVQCIARTSGLQTGQILSTLTSVKIYGRCSPSHTYQVASTPSGDGLPIGIPGDSGAWVVDRRHGQLCGHVVAWSQRKRVAYICPMDVLLLDVAQTLGASEVGLPGGEPVVTLEDPSKAQFVKRPTMSEDDIREDMRNWVNNEEYEAPELADISESRRSADFEASPTRSNLGSSTQGSSNPIRLETSSELHGLVSRLEDLKIERTQRIGVGG